MSKVFKAAALLAVFVLALTMFWSSTRADQWNKKTVMTFNDAVEVPGAVLQPGTYVFKLMDDAANRNIVQVWNSDETKLVTTFIAISNYRLKATGKTVVNFEERPSGSPEAIKAWFYPGDKYGWEFVYPHKRALELAQANKYNVTSTSAESNSDLTQTPTPEQLSSMQSQQVVAVTPEQKDVTVENTTPPASTTMTKKVAQPTTPQTEPTDTGANKELPKTASPLPLIGLIGLLSLVAAFALRTLSNRLA